MPAAAATSRRPRRCGPQMPRQGDSRSKAAGVPLPRCSRCFVGAPGCCASPVCPKLAAPAVPAPQCVTHAMLGCSSAYQRALTLPLPLLLLPPTLLPGSLSSFHPFRASQSSNAACCSSVTGRSFSCMLRCTSQVVTAMTCEAGENGRGLTESAVCTGSGGGGQESGGGRQNSGGDERTAQPCGGARFERVCVAQPAPLGWRVAHKEPWLRTGTLYH